MTMPAMKARRERPEDGGVEWHERFHAFECYGCGEYTEIRDPSKRAPDRLAELRELLVIDHTECWEFDDAKMAANARKHRSERKRRDNLKSRAGRALDRRGVSWRGR